MSLALRRTAAAAACFALATGGALVLSAPANAASACGSSISKGWYSNQARSWTQGHPWHCQKIGAYHKFRVPGDPSLKVHTTKTNWSTSDFVLSPFSAAPYTLVSNHASYVANR